VFVVSSDEFFPVSHQWYLGQDGYLPMLLSEFTDLRFINDLLERVKQLGRVPK
jgi:hypothetical protein